MSFIGKSISRKFFAYNLLFIVPVAGISFYLYDSGFFSEFTTQQLIALAGVLLVFFAVVSLLVYYLNVFRPLKLILEQVQALLSAKPYKNIYTGRIDEIGVLAHFFNQVTKGFGKVSHDIEDRDRMLSELNIASQLQRDILPLVNPFVKGLQIVAKTKPATELGGDSFNFVDVEGKTYIYIGDVTGHGVAAGLIMTMVHSLINVFSGFSGSAYEIIVNVNKYIKKHVKKAMFMTMVMLSWDHAQKKMTYVGAGHEHILVYRADSGICDAILSGGVALGMVPDNSKIVSEKTLDLNNGDIVVLYSDGIVEARNPADELFGLDRLKQLVIEYAPRYSAEGINYHIAKDAVAYMGTAKQLDDMTLIVIKRDDAISENLQVKIQDQTTNWQA